MEKGAIRGQMGVISGQTGGAMKGQMEEQLGQMGGNWGLHRGGN